MQKVGHYPIVIVIIGIIALIMLVIKMVQLIKVNLKITDHMVKVLIFGLIEQNMLVNSEMEKGIYLVM